MKARLVWQYKKAFNIKTECINNYRVTSILEREWTYKFGNHFASREKVTW